MWVKICANTNLLDARLALEFGADAVGFVFAPSKRQVTAVQVAAITSQLPSAAMKVGVFASRDAQAIAAAAQQAGLNAVQLHESMDDDLLATLATRLSPGTAIIQAVAYEIDAENRAQADARFTQNLQRAFTHPAIHTVLVDTARTGISGGLGITFDWAHVQPLLARARTEGCATRFVLAGGLHAGNLAAAIAALRPDGVDVASGVEARPGMKDRERLQAFIEAACS